MRLTAALAGALLVLTATPLSAQDETRLLRFPTIHGDTIAFTHAGNLYSVPAAGGTAQRVTSHDGQEMFPRYSPDGKWLAFTGQYDGNTEVYVMPAEGGTPKRLTWTATLGRDDVADRMGPNNIVFGWKHDSKTIIFRSRMRTHNDFIGQLYTVTRDGGLPEPLPLPRGGFASYSPDDSKLAYNRIFREFRTWKRYRGGMADDISIYDFKSKKTEVIAPDLASDIIPMWHGDTVYFISDRDEKKRFNLYSWDLKTRALKQHTTFSDFDVKFPSLGDKAIVFENGGYVYKFDLESQKADKVTVKIRDDFPVARSGLRTVGTTVASFEISPDGKRGLFSARGDLFTVPATSGPTRNLTNTPGVHDRNPKWSPDGKTIAYISDASGEDEIYFVPQEGGAASQVTKGGDVYKYEMFWSPDGKKIGWTDRKQRLQFLDVATRETTQVAESKAFEIRDWTWSPDSKWVAYTLPEPSAFAKIWLYSVEQKKSFPVTDAWFASSFPVFSGDGKYLFFVSARDFNPTYGATEFNHTYANMQRIYLVTLQKEFASPFEPKADEVGAADPAAPKIDLANLKIDTDGLVDRVVQLPVAPSNYQEMQSVGGTVYYRRAGGFFLFDLGAKKETALGNVDGYEISHDGKKMLVVQGGKHAIIGLPTGPVAVGEAMNLSGLEVKLDRQAEWKQMYHECWRQMRDFFYDPGMHGVDWPAVRDKYAPLVEHVHHRADLTYIVGEMIGELNAGHAYVGGGEVPAPPRTPMGLLGAELTRDPATRYYKIARILKGANWDPATRSPLTEVGVNVKEGEYIIAVNGQPANELTNIYEALVNTANRQVVLKVNAKPEAGGARSVTVVPIADESKLYYHDWVQGNIAKVDRASNGKFGYVHVPDMLQTGLNEFAKYYYPQLGKKALVIDMRGNGGGNVSPMLIERLRRELAMVGISRNGTPNTQPGATFLGPKVCLLNEFSASDGDLFPFQFKYYKLGKLVGKRSWGGVVGIRGTLPLLDGGTLNRPEFARYDIDGKAWLIEGHGVDPDIVVDNDPAKEYAGEDEQLNRAVAELIQELKEKGEKNLPPAPAYPKK